MSKKWALLSLSAIPLLLAGCDSENLDNVMEATTEIERISSEAVEDLNQLAETETQLQEQFSETLETDEDLATLRDESSPVFENITAREEILKDLEAVENDLEVNQEVLATYEGELLDLNEVAEVDSAVDDFESSLAAYIEDYSASLTSEREFFTQISEEGATYEDFVNGISTINEERESLREPLVDLDSVLVNLDEQIAQLQLSIEEQQSEEE